MSYRLSGISFFYIRMFKSFLNQYGHCNLNVHFLYCSLLLDSFVLWYMKLYYIYIIYDADFNECIHIICKRCLYMVDLI